MRNRTYIIILFIISTLLFYLNFQQREYGWDMPGYIGSYYQVENSNNLENQKNVYLIIKKEAPKFQYDKMVGFYQPENWKYFMTKNADAFNLQIPYYSIKVFYVFLISLFHKVGFTLPIASFLPNIISYFILGFLLYFTFKEILKEKLLSFSLTVLVLIIPQFRYLATIPSPDMLTILILVWFGYSLVKKQKFYIQFMILLLLIFSRPDFIIFGLTFLFFNFMFDLLEKKRFSLQCIAFGIIMVSLYFLILKINNYPGWKDVFYDSFLQRRKYVTSNAELTFQQYIEVVVKNIINFKKVTLIATTTLIIVLYFCKDLWIRIFAIFIFLNIYIKFLFFPAAGEYRFFAGFLLLLFIAAIYALRDKLRKTYVIKGKIYLKIKHLLDRKNVA